MKTENEAPIVWHIGIAFVVGSVLFILLALAVKFSTSAPAIDANRAKLRAKSLAEIRATEAKIINTVGWADEARGIVRLPIDTAIQLAAKEWQNPAAARKDLIARAEKAAAPAPKTTPKPSAFE